MRHSDKRPPIPQAPKIVQNIMRRPSNDHKENDLFEKKFSSRPLLPTKPTTLTNTALTSTVTSLICKFSNIPSPSLPLTHRGVRPKTSTSSIPQTALLKPLSTHSTNSRDSHHLYGCGGVEPDGTLGPEVDWIDSKYFTRFSSLTFPQSMSPST